MTEKTNVMKSITSSPSLADNLAAIGAISAFLSECLCENREKGELTLGTEAVTGMYWIFRVIDIGIREVAETM